MGSRLGNCTPLFDVEQNVDAPDSVPPVAGSSDKKQKPRNQKRISWAQLLKRTFKIDVLGFNTWCDKCGGRMKLVGVVFDQRQSQPLCAHWVYLSGRLPLHQPAPGSCLIATIATIRREQMSTTAGPTNEGHFRILKSSKHPRLAQLSKLAEDGGSLSILTYAPRDEWSFGRVALPNGKIQQKQGLRLTKRWGCEG